MMINRHHIYTHIIILYLLHIHMHTHTYEQAVDVIDVIHNTLYGTKERLRQRQAGRQAAERGL